MTARTRDDRPPRALPRELRVDWAHLGAPTGTRTYFQRSALDAVPDPVARWLGQAIRPGTRLLSTVELEMHGEIRIRNWSPFRAVQRIDASSGFIWTAAARLGGVVPIVGADRFTRGTGAMAWRIGGVVPVVRASGPDVTRSAAARFAAEILATMPAAALSRTVSWAALDADRAAARMPAGGENHDITITVAPDGTLTSMALPRWGNPDSDPFAMHTFGAEFRGTLELDGYTVPREVTAGWHPGTDRWTGGQFIRYAIDRVHFR